MICPRCDTTIRVPKRPTVLSAILAFLFPFQYLLLGLVFALNEDDALKEVGNVMLMWSGISIGLILFILLPLIAVLERTP